MHYLRGLADSQNGAGIKVVKCCACAYPALAYSAVSDAVAHARAKAADDSTAVINPCRLHRFDFVCHIE